MRKHRSKPITSAAIICCSAFGGLSAQTNDDALVTIWNGFLHECSQVVADFEGYIDALPKPGPLGETVIVTTDDGLMSRVSSSVQSIPVFVLVHTIAGTTHVSCSVGSAFQSQADVADLTRNFTSMLDLNTVEYVGGNISGDHVAAEPALTVGQLENWYTYSLGNFFASPVNEISANFGPWSMSFAVGFTRSQTQ